MKISKAKKSDAKELFKIECEVFKDDCMAMKLGSFYYHINKNILYKVEVNKNIVGYILWLKRKSFLRLYSLAILEQFQGMKIASKLLIYSLKNIEKKSLHLEVRISNSKAINLYKKFGFKKIKVLKDYYKNEDALIMRLER